MSDTRIERAICLSIAMIADRKISQAGFDKTIQGVVDELIDKTTGLYKIKYQDSTFSAFASNTNAVYEDGQEVFILVPKGDMTNTKTILRGVTVTATNYLSTPEIDSKYHKIGPNIGGNVEYLLSSYWEEWTEIYNINNEENTLNIDQLKAKLYITRGDRIALGFTVQTSLAASQAGGDYGVIFNLVIKDSLTGAAATRPYVVSAKDLIGNPYSAIKLTTVETLVDDIDVGNFETIESVQVFCYGFPQDLYKKDIKDIVIPSILINGANALTADLLSGYSLNIDYSQNGNILDEGINSITLKAEVKIKGNIPQEEIQYYWFRLNGLMFRGNLKWSIYGGDGWECLNNYSNNRPVALTSNLIVFVVSQELVDANQDQTLGAKEGYTVPLTILPVLRKTKVKCVAIVNYKTVSGEGNVIDKIIGLSYIDSSDKIMATNLNKTNYYLDAGSPTLTCVVLDKDGNLEDIEGYTFTWKVSTADGQYLDKPQATLEEIIDYNNTISTWNYWEDLYLRADLVAKEEILENSEYTNSKEKFESVLSALRVVGNVYYNFPIKSISGSSRILCSITDSEGKYCGTASITLYNHMEVSGMYTLSIENGTQVFQYDNQGNSPASPQLLKPIEIAPLGFTFLDNEGVEISFDQITTNGYIEWLFPKNNTLLIPDNSKNGEPLDDSLIIGTDKALSADYYIYKNIPSFTYSIAKLYDPKNINNDIKLVIKYKDLIFDAYTNFTFPKDGDPGTNGTKYVGKITPMKGLDKLNTDRVYLDSNNNVYDDNGYKVDKLKFLLYNNGEVVSSNVGFWTCPPVSSDKIGNKIIHDTRNNKHYVNVNSGIITKNNYDSYNPIEDKPVDIIRAQNGTGDDLKYFAEYLINYVNLSSLIYRLKVVPKTGFSYVVYAEDGTLPNYDNTLPFEVIVEKALLVGENTWYVKQDGSYSYTWSSIGPIEIKSLGNKCWATPASSFDGSDLTTAIVCTVEGIGWIHIPIYMILNRYGHSALNSWDGNSVQIDKDGNNTILAPQIGAGEKNDDNSFTGVFMGNVKDNLGNKDTGFMGYHKGLRTIFLDAKTGKAEFGKNNAGKIILNPDLKIKGKDYALIYSGNYPIDNFKDNDYDVVAVGNLDINRNKENKGLIIDLSTPQIGFGSGNFTVNSKGEIVARGGGEIAGWEISDNKLEKGSTGMASSNSNFTRPDGNTDTKAFYSTNNFYATHNGYLFSKLGQIAGWNINTNTLFKETENSNVGMNSNPDRDASNGKYKVNNTLLAKAFFAGDDNQFYVTHDGFLRSVSGKIGPWTLSSTAFTNGNVGMGNRTFSKDNPFTNGTINARLWAGTGSGDADLNFAVDENGKLYAKDGKIAGWTIDESKLSSGNIKIDSTGSISASGSFKWSINSNGDASFNNATVSGGTFSPGKINAVGGYGNGGSAPTAGTLDLYIAKLTVKYLNASLADIQIARVTKLANKGATFEVSSNSITINGTIKTGNNSFGKSGTLTFSDGAKMVFYNGILTSCSGGTDTTWP